MPCHLLALFVEGVKDKTTLPDIEENGKTALENARKKAVSYAKALGKTVFSMDNALHLTGLPDEKQPGLNVRRFNGASDRPTDEQVLEYYTGLVKSLGGNVDGFWEFGICVANPDGDCRETVIKSPRKFVDKPSNKMVEGYPLESIQVEPESGKYISEMSQEEQDAFWQKAIGEPLLEFVKSIEFI